MKHQKESHRRMERNKRKTIQQKCYKVIEICKI